MKFAIHNQSLQFVAALVVIMLVLQLVSSYALSVLQFDRSAVASGQWWRLLSAHWVHAGAGHALLNMASVVVLAWLFPDRKWIDWLILLAGAMIVVGSGLVLISSIDWYLGFSGVAHGLYAGAAVLELKSNRRFGLLLLVAVLIKLAYEQSFGPLPGSAAVTTVNVIVDAHLWGAAGGLAAATVYCLFRRNQNRTH